MLNTDGNIPEENQEEKKKSGLSPIGVLGDAALAASIELPADLILNPVADDALAPAAEEVIGSLAEGILDLF